ncbi:hypothetical protein CRM22_009518 [Opisthorchis felineus]|uniref:Uncharacterized protein n=1 Tax=Opisthorchis felineus TaxID=147828 RepID=A0A4S2L6F6_OPIFE|nr:hypothetical protein CRM22_009518 [Opisthorchis felineus]
MVFPSSYPEKRAKHNGVSWLRNSHVPTLHDRLGSDQSDFCAHLQQVQPPKHYLQPVNRVTNGKHRNDMIKTQNGEPQTLWDLVVRSAHMLFDQVESAPMTL